MRRSLLRPGSSRKHSRFLRYWLSTRSNRLHVLSVWSVTCQAATRDGSTFNIGLCTKFIEKKMWCTYCGCGPITNRKANGTKLDQAHHADPSKSVCWVRDCAVFWPVSTPKTRTSRRLVLPHRNVRRMSFMRSTRCSSSVGDNSNSGTRWR